MSVKAQMSLAEINRATKNAAQTMTGTNSSTDGATAWDEIKAARGMPTFRYNQ